MILKITTKMTEEGVVSHYVNDEGETHFLQTADIDYHFKLLAKLFKRGRVEIKELPTV